MKTKIKNFPILISATIRMLALSAHAQFAIDWSTLDGGGGMSSGGGYSVSGTIGQPDAGQSTGGGYHVSGGFWGVAEAIPSDGALTVSRSGTNVVVKWTFPSSGFVLQQCNELLPPPLATLWTDVPSAAAIHVGSQWTVTIPSPSGNRFFRLRKP